ncbi:hypothetical protein VIAG107301_02250 [Vibrio agarivorans]
MNLKPSNLHIMIFAASAAGPILAANFESPDSVDNTIAQQNSPQKSWRESLAENSIRLAMWA